MSLFKSSIIRLVAGALVLAALSIPASAEWILSRATGVVWLVSPDNTARQGVSGEVVPDRWMLATGANGRAMVTRNAEFIALGPNTQIVITDEGARTQVLQTTGVAEFEVEHQNVQHFAVETPVLAAVVKGTHFTVTVDGRRGEVAVERGAVEVTALEIGQQATITAGQEAEVDAPNAPLQLGGTGTLPPILTVAPRDPVVPAAVMAPAAAAPAAARPDPGAGTPDPTADGGGNGNNSNGNNGNNGNGNNGNNGNGNGNNGNGNGNGDTAPLAPPPSDTPPPAMPTDKDQCKHGGWAAFGFDDEKSCKDFLKDLDHGSSGSGSGSGSGGSGS